MVAEVVLVRPMYAQFYLVRLFLAGVFILADLYLLGLWTFAFVRTGKNFFLLLAISIAGAVFVGIINAAFAYDLPGIKRFDPSNILYGAAFFVLQPFVLLLAIVGQTMFVKWILRSAPRASEPSV